jgi:hypothetical protein
VEKFIRIGVDLAKNYFQVHALASESSPAVYPFEGALALRPTDFIEVIGKISDLLGHVNVSEH